MKPFTVCIRDPCCVHTKMYIAPRSASIISGVESGQLAWPGECATVARQTDSSIHEWCLPHWEGAGGGRAGFLSDNILLSPLVYNGIFQFKLKHFNFKKVNKVLTW